MGQDGSENWNGSGKGRGKGKEKEKGSSGTRKGKNKATAKEESSGDEYPPLYLSDSPAEDVETTPVAIAQDRTKKGKQKAVGPSDLVGEFTLFPSIDASFIDDSDNFGPDASAEPEDLLDAADDRLLRSSPSLGLASHARGGRHRSVAYVVFCGRKTGVFGSWSATNAQVSGFQGSAHQGFSTAQLADAAWAHALAIGAGYAPGEHGPPPEPRAGNGTSRTADPPSTTSASRVDRQPGLCHRQLTHTATVQPFKRDSHQDDNSSHRRNDSGVPDSKAKKENLDGVAPAPLKKIPDRFPFPFGDPRAVNRTGPSSNVAHRPTASRASSSAVPPARRSTPSRPTYASPPARTVGDPWYVVLRGDLPGVYPTRSLAAEALGHGPDRLVVPAATRQLADALFVEAFIHKAADTVYEYAEHESYRALNNGRPILRLRIYLTKGIVESNRREARSMDAVFTAAADILALKFRYFVSNNLGGGFTKSRTTDPVTANPSELGVQPYPRVMRRKDDCYMRPRSPQSPTLQWNQQAMDHISGSARARKASGYKLTNVAELRVKTFDIAVTPRCPIKEKVASPSWSPTPTFDPSIKEPSSFSLLHSLDMFPALGLPENAFWKLFSKCQEQVSQIHIGHAAQPLTMVFSLDPKVKVDVETILRRSFLRLLDVHDIGNEAGIPEDAFRAIFHTCEHCGRYMTQRMSFSHKEDLDDDSDGYGRNSRKCFYLRMRIAKDT
ncbi:hypothetical protein BDN70DRAFT_902071 [Pholiota conissans]|uniref:Ribonuclease H1 N-terminal domain-containing protein n=1 Tax=Pholiota conissans TaxID=109636 RepID=A0A9P6CRX3_9AGAR|nr:hypothetical protein BDN70DRAFT_902071 [Pholiota conissans]